MWEYISIELMFLYKILCVYDNILLYLAVVMNTTPACAVVLALTTSNRHMLSHRWKAFLSVGLGAQAKLCKCLVLNES